MPSPSEETPGQYISSQHAHTPKASRSWRDWASSAITLSLIVGTALAGIKPLRSHVPWMLWEEDDFFYYLKVAQNLAHGAGSTFNSLVPTNGYHPLWLLVLTAVSAVTANGQSILVVLEVLIVGATFATYLLCRKLLLGAGGDGIDRLTASAFAAYVAMYSIHIFYGGMEVILTVPLLLAVVLVCQLGSSDVPWWSRGFRQSFCLGLLVALMVLSRLDAMLFAGLLFLGLLLERRLRSQLKLPQIAGLALGLSPIAIYLAINQHFFHTWLPVSGMAKQLKASHLPAAAAWDSFLHRPAAQLVNVVPLVLGLVLLPTLFKRLNPTQRVLYPALLIFPFVHLLVLSCFSDWKLWGWYFYPFRPGLLAAFVLFCLWKPGARLLRVPAMTVVLCLVVLFQIFRNDRGVGGQDEMYDAGTDLAAFAATHPGIYAMGDRSGMVGYLLPDPLVQTEGLMMDRGFLTRIQEQAPLRDALAAYRVRYYVGTAPQGYAGCFQASEPYQAGPQSPHMRGVFCEQPVATFVHGTYRTLVFDLSQPPAPGDF